MENGKHRPNPSLSERFRLREIESTARKAGSAGPKLLDLSWLNEMPVNQDWWRMWAAISAAVDMELEKKKLFHRDSDKFCAPLENGIPSLLKKTSFRAEFEAPGGDEALYDQEIYAPDSVDKILEQDGLFSEAEEEPEATSEEEGPFAAGSPIGPARSVPPLNALMRRAPKNLKESIARDLFDSSYFLHHEPKDLLPALCFFEVGIVDQETFREVWELVYKGGRFQRPGPHGRKGKKFSYKEFKRDKLRLFHILKRKKRDYFHGNRPLLREVGKLSKDPAKSLESLWDRMDQAIGNLTQKQRNALWEVYVKGRPQTRVAKRMRISLDSLRDRLEGGLLKIRMALPELSNLSPSATPKREKERSFLLSGLYDSRAAREAAPVFRVNPKTGEKTELNSNRGQKRPKAGADRAAVLAWSIYSTPVPDFGFTDYFLGLVPRGALDRRSAPDTLHDRSAAKSNYANKLKVHLDRRPVRLDEDSGSE